jgi:hypothetical protein
MRRGVRASRDAFVRKFPLQRENVNFGVKNPVRLNDFKRYRVGWLMRQRLWLKSSPSLPKMRATLRRNRIAVVDLSGKIALLALTARPAPVRPINDHKLRSLPHVRESCH